MKSQLSGSRHRNDSPAAQDKRIVRCRVSFVPPNVGAAKVIPPVEASWRGYGPTRLSIDIGRISFLIFGILGARWNVGETEGSRNASRMVRDVRVWTRYRTGMLMSRRGNHDKSSLLQTIHDLSSRTCTFQSSMSVWAGDEYASSVVVLLLLTLGAGAVEDGGAGGG
jgi:hypothetical protein